MTLGVAELPVNVTVGVVQVICNGATTDTDGNPPLAKTPTVVVVEHPVTVFVAVTE